MRGLLQTFGVAVPESELGARSEQAVRYREAQSGCGTGNDSMTLL
jgi:hypothetical protein